MDLKIKIILDIRQIYYKFIIKYKIYLYYTNFIFIYILQG